MTTDKKKAKHFISALARNIDGDVDTEAAFSAAIRKLPPCELKKILLKNVEKYYTKLQQKLEKNNNKAQEEDAEKKTEASTGDDFQYLYNLFHRDRLNIKKGSLDGLNKEQESILCCNLLYQRLPRVTDEEIAQLVSSTQKAKKKGGGQLSWLLDLLEQLTGVTDTVSVQKVMKYCFSQISEDTEALLEKKEIKKMQSIKEDLQNILCFCHVKRQQLSGKSPHPSLEDIMAALASIYLDLCLVTARHEDCNRKKLSRQLCSFCCFLFQHSQQHLMDVLLQQSAVTSDDLDLAIPFYRKIFTVLSTSDNKSYTKYMAGVRQVVQWFGRDAVTDVLQNAKHRPAPSGYVDWLREADGSIVDEMPDTRFFKGSQVTQFLLDEASQGLLDRMLDLVADWEESEREETDDLHSQGQENSDGGSLFFIDKTAPQKTSDGVQEEIHEDAADKMDDVEGLEEGGASSESDSDQEIPSSSDEEEETESKVPFIHTDILKQTEKAIDTALSEAAAGNAEMLVEKIDEEDDEEEMESDDDDSEDDGDESEDDGDESEDDGGESEDDDEQEEDGEDSETKESKTFSGKKLEDENAFSPRLQSLKSDQGLVESEKSGLINGSSETSSSHDLEQDEKDSDSVTEGDEAHKVITRSKLEKPEVASDVMDIEIAVTRQLRQLRKRQSVAPEQDDEGIPPKKKAENTPKSTARTPKSGEKTPKPSGKTSLSVANIPKNGGKSPKSAGETSKAAGKTPASTVKTPKVANKTPKATGATPKVSEKTPLSNTETPKATGKTPKSVGKTPKPVDKTPKSLDRTPKSVKKGLASPTVNELKDTPRKKSARLSLVSHKRLAEVREELADSSQMILRKRQNSESETDKPKASVFDFHSDMSDLDLTPKKNQKTAVLRDSDKLKKVRRATLSGDLPVRKTPKQDDGKKTPMKVASPDKRSPDKNVTPRSPNRRRSTRIRNTPKKLLQEQ